MKKIIWNKLPLKTRAAALWEGGLRDASATIIAAKLRGEQLGPKLREIAIKGLKRLAVQKLNNPGPVKRSGSRHSYEFASTSNFTLEEAKKFAASLAARGWLVIKPRRQSNGKYIVEYAAPGSPTYRAFASRRRRR